MRKVRRHNQIKSRRAKRVRAHLKTGAAKPRLSVFRSGRHIYAQIIDDGTGKTIVSASSLSLEPKNASAQGGKKTDTARLVGAALAEKAKRAGVTVVVFDRGAYAYHGRVKALAEAVRRSGIKL